MIARLALLVLLLAPAARAAEADRPNIVLIMADDLGWSDIGCYGGEVETPALDRLAKEGLRFRQFYNNAKCTTTRASLVTGLYPRRGKGGLLRPDMTTIGEALKPAGYATVLSGKWHLGMSATTHPYKRGFDEVYGLLDGCCNFFDPGRPDPPYKGGKTRYFTHNDRRITEFPKGYYTTDAFTDHAIENARAAVKSKRPFLLHVTYTAPHYPLHAKPEDIAKYRGKYRDGWDMLRRRRYERQVAMGLVDPKTWPFSEKDSKAYAWETADPDFEDHRMAVYAAMIDCMDRNIGRLMAELETLGVADNTIVMFLSDNGGCSEEPGGRDPKKRTPGVVEDYVAVGPAWGWAQNAPFRRYKSWAHEGGVATPFIVRWPGRVKPGTITDQIGHIIDLLPTLCDAAGAPLPSKVEGASLLPVFRGETRPAPERLCWEWAGNRAIREGRWKLVWDSLVKRWELYDLEADRTETRDLAAEQPERVKEMAARWIAWARETELNTKP